MKAFVERRPLVFVILLMLVLEAFVIVALILSKLAGIDIVALDLPIMLANAIFAVILLSSLRWWGEAGFNSPSNWQNLRLLLIPVALLIGPALFFQPQLPDSSKLVGLVIVTLLIGFQEEAIFRGVLLKALKPRGIMQAVLISALLFGIIHINSLFVGRDPLFVAAQIVASFLGAIGLAALRIRLNSIWPLILLHAFNDFVQFIATGGLEAESVAVYIPVIKIVISGLMALYGWYLLRGEIKQQSFGEAVSV